MIDNPAKFCIEVCHSSEGFYVPGANGTRDYIRLGGSIVQSFLPNWSPLFVYSGLSDINLLELQHEKGHRATWFLDKNFSRISGSAKDLSPPFDEMIRVASRSLLADIWNELIISQKPMLSQAARDFYQVNEATRAEILHAAQQADAHASIIIDLSLLTKPVLNCNCANGEWPLKRKFLEAIIEAPLMERFSEAYLTGRLTWPSPVDGAPMRLLGGLFLDDFRFAYRMLDERNELVVVIVVTGHYEQTIAVFLPQANTILVPSELAMRHLKTHFSQLASVLEGHIWNHALALEGYFRAESFEFASVLRGQPGVHLGHQLWNELSAIEEIVQALPPERQPLFLVPNANEGTEIYGPLDTLFPELEGRVVRFAGSVAVIIRDAYTRNLCVTRLTGQRISANLRARILTFANSTASGREAHDAAEVISASGRPIVLIGLRVENRTLVDLAGFVILLMERMITLFGEAVFVIDGHNQRISEANAEAMFVSHWEHAATSRPHDVEQAIVDNLKTHFINTKVSIVSTIGAPIYSSLVWSSYSQAFFAIWGAGLAKYRWVANAPGFVVSSAWNLNNRKDIDIYSSHHFMEEPAPLVFGEPAYVTDRPDQRPLVVPGGTLNSSYANFDISLDDVWPQVENFLKSTIR